MYDSSQNRLSSRRTDGSKSMGNSSERSVHVPRRESSELVLFNAAARCSTDDEEYGELSTISPRHDNDCPAHRVLLSRRNLRATTTYAPDLSRRHVVVEARLIDIEDGIVAVLSLRAVERFGKLVSDLDKGLLGLRAATVFATREAVTVTEALEQTQYGLVAGATCFPGKIRA
ncbi:hypothetical protein DYB31_013685 [Aphanomyces astaci]|uniref:Uncharacterized protein n=1 Tax=Aphanomyces astaci TaxID=112090 RepID=A0A397FA87_APHAT|nr:hypothetical protein DYB31_013685 [Aphanomyces astaci]